MNLEIIQAWSLMVIAIWGFFMMGIYAIVFTRDVIMRD